MVSSLSEFKLDAVTYFRRYNIDRDGNISLKEFRDALYKLGIDPAAGPTQRLINYFRLPNRDAIKFSDFEYALRSLGVLENVVTRQPFAAGPLKYRLLSSTELESGYQCLDYIALTILNSKKQQAKAYIDSRFPASIKFEDFKNLIKIDLKIPSNDEVTDELCLLLDGGKGFIPKSKLIDGLSGVRINQVKPETNPQNFDNKEFSNNPGFNPLAPKEFNMTATENYNPNYQNNPNNLNPWNTVQYAPEGNFSQPGLSQQISPRSIMKFNQPPVPVPIKKLYDYLNLKKITLVKLLGKDSGATFPKPAFVKTMKDERILIDNEITELIGIVGVPNDRIDLSKLSSLLSDLNKPSIRIDPFSLFKESLKDKRVTLTQLFGTNPTIHKDTFVKSAGVLQLDPNVLNTILNDCKARDPQFIDLQMLKNKLDGNIAMIPQRPDSMISQRPDSMISQRPNTMTSQRPNTMTSQRPENNLLLQLNSELVNQGMTAEEFFSNHDTDGNGILSINEFVQAFRSMRSSIPESQLQDAFNLIDMDKSGSLSINEIAARIPGARGNLEKRLTGLDLGQRFEEEVKQIFDMLDKDKDGSIDYTEIALGIKAYCMMPSQSQTKELMSKIDKNHNGKIEFDEFKSFVEENIKREILKQEDEMQDLREKFIQADLMRVGYLTKEQLFEILKSNKADITQDELNHLISFADYNHSGTIDIDEFMLLMTGASPEVYSDPQASAILFNIRKSRKLSPMDFFKMFQGMPAHFLPSFVSEQHKLKKNLPSTDIIPGLDPSGLHFKDVNPTASKSKLNSLTYLRQNPASFGGYITVELASGISIPDGKIVQKSCILRRCIRICHWNSLTQKFIGNSIFIEAQ